MKLDILYLLSRIGLKSLQSKAVSLVLILTFVYSALVYVSASLTLSGQGASAEAVKDLSWTIAAGAGTVLFILLGALAIAIMRSVNRKLGALIRVTEEVGTGNLTARVSIRTDDEFEMVATGFNQMMEQLSESVKNEARQKEALRHSEMQYKSLFDRANDAIVIFEPETEEILETNMKACEMYGYGKDELVGRSLKEFTEDVSRGETYIGEILKTEKRHNIESVHIDREGKQVHLLVSCSVIDYEGKRAILSMHKDITDRKRAEEALRVSEERHRKILASIEDGYYEVDLAGDLVFFNEPVGRILGYNEKELLGLNNREYVDKDVSRDVFRAFNQVFKNGESIQEFSYPIIRKDGVKRVVETSITLMKDVSGEPSGFRGIIRDVTDRKQAAEALEQHLDEFFKIVSRISKGDLTVRGSESESTLGRVVNSINTMIDNFSSMLTQVKQIGLSVSSSATEILAAAEQIAAGSQRQADEITNTSSAVEEMAASMSQVSRNSEASAHAARRALDMAEQGDRSVRDTSQAMSRIESAVQQTAEKMRLLGSRSSEISEIIDLINDIAAQTNLLALNAAIEAAHAGEAGLGFSVVAEEIRKLAERSARATRDVGSLIKAVQKETSEALAATEIGMIEVKSGTQLAVEASSALHNMSEAVRESSELIEEISAASEEQARVTRNLAGAMQTISSITLQTSAGAHETAQTIQSMVGLSEQLNLAISQFRVKDDYIHPFSYDIPGSPMNPGSGNRMAGYTQGD
ncbi:MAG TPA: PAS domain S-box protein [Blastocatellia bacterium]|nr:PAS domain S-box protein [Blastocatellia bacterium]